MTSSTHGVHHVGLTVPDIKAAQAFFTDALGFAVVGEKPNYPAIFVSDGTVMITLWQVDHPGLAAPFDRQACVGLHHLALLVDSEVALAKLHSRLAVRSDVTIEFAPEPLGKLGARHMMCAISGGLRLEFISVEQ